MVARGQDTGGDVVDDNRAATVDRPEPMATPGKTRTVPPIHKVVLAQDDKHVLELQRHHILIASICNIAISRNLFTRNLILWRF